MFRVTTLPVGSAQHGSKSPGAKGGDEDGESGDLDATDFFGKPAYLTVSGQLSAETYACTALPCRNPPLISPTPTCALSQIRLRAR